MLTCATLRVLLILLVSAFSSLREKLLTDTTACIPLSLSLSLHISTKEGEEVRADLLTMELLSSFSGFSKKAL